MTIDGLVIGQFSAGALVGFIVILVLTGRLVPRRNLEDVCKERDSWRQAAEERSAQLSRALESGDLATRALDALSRTAEQRRGET